MHGIGVYIQEQAFKKLKQCLVTAPILTIYDPNKEIKVNADASSYGIGAVLLQKQNINDWKPVSYVSRALTDTETRYSQIEKECLTFTWTCERFSDYILGKPIIGETVYKPLVPLLTTHMLEKLQPRIQRFRMRLMRVNLHKIVHIPSKEMYTSDALSRLVTSSLTTNNDSVLDRSCISDADMSSFVDSIFHTLSVSDQRLEKIRQDQQDEVCQKIQEYYQDGWPERHSVSDAIKPYWSKRGELTLIKNGS